MNSSNFNKFIEDFSSINSSDATNFERVLKKHPYFQTAALFLAKSNPLQNNTQTAALRSADRRVLRTWLDENYRKELEKEKRELEARQAVLETENYKENEELDINTESINAFDKLVGTPTVVPKNKEISENTSEEINQKLENTTENNQEIENKEVISESNFFDEIEENNSITKTTENQIDSSSFFDDLEDNEKTDNSTINSDANFFDEIDENESNKPIFKEQSDINEHLPTSIPEESTDANFFDEIDENESNKPIFKEQSCINESLPASIPEESTDANFFDEIDENKSNEPIFKEQSDINESLLTNTVTEIPPTTTDANFFDEIESDDEIFGEAQKDLDNYDFPDFEDEKEEIEKNQKANENKKTDEEGSFFDDI